MLRFSTASKKIVILANKVVYKIEVDYRRKGTPILKGFFFTKIPMFFDLEN